MAQDPDQPPGQEAVQSPVPVVPQRFSGQRDRSTERDQGGYDEQQQGRLGREGPAQVGRVDTEEAQRDDGVGADAEDHEDRGSPGRPVRARGRAARRTPTPYAASMANAASAGTTASCHWVRMPAADGAGGTSTGYVARVRCLRSVDAGHPRSPDRLDARRPSQLHRAGSGAPTTWHRPRPRSSGRALRVRAGRPVVLAPARSRAGDRRRGADTAWWPGTGWPGRSSLGPGRLVAGHARTCRTGTARPRTRPSPTSR